MGTVNGPCLPMVSHGMASVPVVSCGAPIVACGSPIVASGIPAVVHGPTIVMVLQL